MSPREDVTHINAITKHISHLIGNNSARNEINRKFGDVENLKIKRTFPNLKEKPSIKPTVSLPKLPNSKEQKVVVLSGNIYYSNPTEAAHALNTNIVTSQEMLRLMKQEQKNLLTKAKEA